MRTITSRLLLPVGGVLAAVLVAAPATLALSGNTSFSRDIPVPVPSGAHQVHFVDRSDSPAELRVASSTTADDHGGLRSGAGSREAEPGDDSGGSRGDDSHDDSHESGDDGGHDGGDDGSGRHGGRG
jgi:hypothetical protein